MIFNLQPSHGSSPARFHPFPAPAPESYWWPGDPGVPKDSLSSTFFSFRRLKRNCWNVWFRKTVFPHWFSFNLGLLRLAFRKTWKLEAPTQNEQEKKNTSFLMLFVTPLAKKTRFHSFAFSNQRLHPTAEPPRSWWGVAAPDPGPGVPKEAFCLEGWRSKERDCLRL